LVLFALNFKNFTWLKFQVFFAKVFFEKLAVKVKTKQEQQNLKYTLLCLKGLAAVPTRHSVSAKTYVLRGQRNVPYITWWGGGENMFSSTKKSVSSEV
jgi:hypothetical protein